MIPSPWVAVVLALGTYRVVRLIGWDDFPPIARIRDWVTGAHISKGPYVDGNHIVYRRPTLEHFLHCPFCQGWWVSLTVYVWWLIDPTSILYILAPFALSGAVGLIARNLDP